MTEKIEPALRPKEWRSAIELGLATSRHSVNGDPILLSIKQFQESLELRWGRSLHWLAALVLYGQSFGFTHEDVDTLRYLMTERCPRCGGDGWKMPARPKCVNCGWSPPESTDTLADRIEALLPPRTDAGS